ncbi:MAG: arylsulfatase [Phycisphaerae bacterium]|nr:arylsulfatase [Phycisphaerae bacterium]
MRSQRYLTAGRMTVVAWGLLLSSVGAAAAPTTSTSRPGAERPNIIFILADDLGYGDLGCYGQKKIKTPCLDRMASEGVRFTQAYAGGNVCAPSRCCLMTGLHTGHARIRDNDRGPLLPGDVTVAEVLKSAGYATGCVGKWGLGEAGTTGIPTRQGFDEWFGFLNQTQAHDYYPESLWRGEQRVGLAGNKGGRQGQYVQDVFTSEALDFIRRHQHAPFFLYLAYTIPHANNELGRTTGNGLVVPDDVPYSDRPWPQPLRNYAAMITRLDHDVGKLLALLGELGIERKTVVFFSGDNGPHREGGADPDFFESAGPLRGHKKTFHEGGIRIPLIVRWPDHIASGAVSDAVCAFWDFLPTAAALAGAKAPKGIDGVSILPALGGEPQPRREYLYWERPGYLFDQAARIGDFKAVRRGANGPIELYDLETDIGEKRDIASQHPQLVAQAEDIFRSARTASKDYPFSDHLPTRRRVYGFAAIGAVVLGVFVVLDRRRRKGLHRGESGKVR